MGIEQRVAKRYVRGFFQFLTHIEFETAVRDFAHKVHGYVKFFGEDTLHFKVEVSIDRLRDADAPDGTPLVVSCHYIVNRNRGTTVLTVEVGFVKDSQLWGKTRGVYKGESDSIRDADRAFAGFKKHLDGLVGVLKKLEAEGKLVPNTR